MEEAYQGKLNPRGTFPKKIDGIQTCDELNVYLITNDLKPASAVTLGRWFYERPKASLTDSDIEDFCHLLESLGISYKLGEVKKSYPPDILRQSIENDLPLQSKPVIDRVELKIGRSEEDLLRLEKAHTDSEVGEALGYPKEAVASYNKKIEGVVRNGSYSIVKIREAEREGIKPPSWLAYISHSPEQLDIAKGKISKSTEALGKKYEQFVKKNNPDLARRMEEFFETQRSKPDEWILDKDGRYRMHFKNHPSLGDIWA